MVTHLNCFDVFSYFIIHIPFGANIYQIFFNLRIRIVRIYPRAKHINYFIEYFFIINIYLPLCCNMPHIIWIDSYHPIIILLIYVAYSSIPFIIKGMTIK